MAKKRGYTITELLVIITMVAIAVALVIDVKQRLRSDYISSIAITPDGSRVIAALADGAVVAWDVETGTRSSILGPWTENIAFGRNYAFSQDASMAVYLRLDPSNMQNTLEVADLSNATRKDVRKLLIYGPMAISSDGGLLAFVNSQNQLTIVHLRDASIPDLLLGPFDASGSGDYPQAIAFSADGADVFLAGSSGELQSWNLQAGTVKRVPAKGEVYTSRLAFSPDGSQFAILTLDPAPAGYPPEVLQLYDSKTFQLLEQAEVGFSISTFSFIDGKTIAVFSDQLDIWGTDPLAKVRSIRTNELDWSVRAVSAGKQIAVADLKSVYMLEGNRLRRLGTVGRSSASGYGLAVALVAFIIGWRRMRKRRSMKTCAECGAKWREPKGRFWVRRSFAQCPKCRGDYLTTDELRRQVARPKLALIKFFGGLLFVIVMFQVLGNEGGLQGWEIIGASIGVLFLAFAVLAVIFILILVFVILSQRIKLRRLGTTGLRSKALPADAMAPAEVLRIGAMTVWAEGALCTQDHDAQDHDGRRDSYRIPSGGELAHELQTCRASLEEVLGEPCPALRESQLYIFATVAAAQKFLPVQGISKDVPAVFCGPWANVGCIAVEGMRWQLRPLVTSIRSLFAYQSQPWPRYGYQLGYLLMNQVAREREREAIDATRRRIALWAAEGSLLPLAEICKRRIVTSVVSAARSALPEHYEKNLKRMSQWLSVGDFFFGPDATAERREQFRRLWQATKVEKKISVAIEQACGCGLADIEGRWKDWAQTTIVGPPAAAPRDIAAVAAEQTIPLALDPAAPIQRRIRAIRVLGNCGWSLGPEPLLALFKSPLPDIQREAFAALRQLSGRMGTERTEDWQPWLAGLRAKEPHQLVGPQT
jgi:hypothetical protein